MKDFRRRILLVKPNMATNFDSSSSFLGDNREGGTPDPIPNSVVKPFIADGTAHKSVEE